MRTVIDPETHGTAFIALVAGTGRPVGDAAAPDNVSYPYAVVYPLADANAFLAELHDDANADAVLQYQVTYVGQTRRSVQIIQKNTRDAVLNGTMTVTGRRISLIDLALAGTVERDDDEQPRLFYAMDIFDVYTHVG